MAMESLILKKKILFPLKFLIDIWLWWVKRGAVCAVCAVCVAVCVAACVAVCVAKPYEALMLYAGFYRFCLGLVHSGTSPPKGAAKGHSRPAEFCCKAI